MTGKVSMSLEAKITDMQKILLISGDGGKEGIFEQQLARCSSAEVLITGSSEEGLEILGSQKIEAVFIDYPLLHAGLHLLEYLRKRALYIPVIAVIAPGSEIAAAEALKEGAFDYVIRGNYSGEALEAVFRRLSALSGSDRDKGDELEQQSHLFKQIYKSQKWWQSIIDAITDYLFVIDESYRILRTNKAFAELFMKEPADIILKPYYRLFDLDRPHEWCSIPRGGEGSFPRSVERRLNGKEYLISCYPICHDDLEAALYIMKDITETRRLKDQVYHLDKLSSLGTLTSGVAHEINNPLTGIIGYTEMLLMKEEGETTK
ncbi:MAG: PAS domain-containing protein, partial [Nitrospiraceae bacterium]